MSTHPSLLRLCALAALALPLASPAIPLTIIGYDVTGTPTAGFGGWSHSYTGTITPDGDTVLGSPTASYSGGTGTLADSVIGTDESNTQLFYRITDAGAMPTITLYFSGLAFIDSIDIFGGPFDHNSIPGGIASVDVNTGVLVSQAISEFGPAATNGHLANARVNLAGSGAENVATSSLTLSNFGLNGAFGDYFSITEITVDGELTRRVPEPATLGLCGLAMLGVGAARRRRV